MQKLLTGGLVIVLLSGVIFLALSSRQTSASNTQPATAAAPGNGTSEGGPAAAVVEPYSNGGVVVAEGRVLPVNSVTLNFSEDKLAVMEVLVSEGESVSKGQALARLDTRDIELVIQDAEASLVAAQSQYAALVAEPSAELLRQKQAEVDFAKAKLRQTQGSVTEADILAAQAVIEQAQAELAAAQRGALPEEIAAATASLDESRARLSQRRDELSAAKTLAEADLQRAANLLRDRQAEYARIVEANRAILARGNQLEQIDLDREAAALRAVQNAELAVSQARVIYNRAVQNEISGIAAAEALVRYEEARLERLTNGPRPEAIAAARARLARAQADLEQLQGEARLGALEAARAQLVDAEAELAALLAPPDPNELLRAQARIDQAQTALSRAQLELDNATLRAPIDGVVATLNLRAGELPIGASDLIIGDVSNWVVVTTNLSELGISQVSVGDPASVSFYALPDLRITGRVDHIRSIGTVGTDRNAEMTYAVTIVLDNSDPRLRWNMSSSVTINPGN